MKHTQGQWTVADDGTVRANGPDVYAQSDQMGDCRGVIVCDLKAGVGSDVWPAVGRRHAQPEADANGRLICAAPDLLAACIEARRIVGLIIPKLTINSDPGAGELLDMLDAAIARTGEQVSGG